MRFRPALAPSARRSKIAARLCGASNVASSSLFRCEQPDGAAAAAGLRARVFARFIRGGDAENSESGSGEAGQRFNWTDLSVASAILNAN